MMGNRCMIMKKVAFICPLYDMENHFDLVFYLYKLIGYE